MSTDLRFPAPKNPKDVAWYGIVFPYPLASVDSITISDGGPVDYSKLGRGTLFPTLGDDVAAPLSYAQLQQKDKTAVFQLSGGTAGREYVIEVGVHTADGNVLFRSAALPVTGL